MSLATACCGHVFAGRRRSGLMASVAAFFADLA
jgi:hypothetical protein